MSEGDSVSLDLPTVSLDARVFDTLVVLANVEQPPNNPRDTGFVVSSKAASYSPGTHVLQIPKWYVEPPNQFHRKPLWLSKPAYELTYTVRYVDHGAVFQQTSSGGVVSGGGTITTVNAALLDWSTLSTPPPAPSMRIAK